MFSKKGSIKHFIKRQMLALVFSRFLGIRRHKFEREGEPGIYQLGQHDHEMNDAIKTALRTLNKFNEALQSGNPDFHFFSLKKQFKTLNQTEHIWITEVFLQENKYFGKVGNLPQFTNDVNMDDTIQVEMDSISDWMYVDKQILRGGYTIRILRERMTTSERSRFDSQNGITLED
jgi:uncharacterized protein YegJ (DUF2314 family)